ncbi:Gaba-gated chloride channel-like protein [Leptotrombidium deliense]|uniref:Gaba-gated chloride channel-like protein n=1 Tax=Leptotrombidium deliense TaxID=299467 RepID=A0A443SGC2_9ACAR|nr:Gaba-gated chloride channel-like protein [Leptotrombidium deliense]
MDLHYYPLDYQNCSVEIESYGYTVSDVVMAWREEPVKGVEEAELPQFTIERYETSDRSEELATGTYQRLSLSFQLKRNIGYFIFQTYLPSILIVMLSWVSFWINHEATSARVALGVRSSLPRISYVKAIDIYLVMCFVFVFAALLEYAAVNYTYWGARAKKKPKRDRETITFTKGVAVTDKSSDDVFNSEEIIELHDIRLSPIASLRNRHGTKIVNRASKETDIRFPPSFRMSNPVHRMPGYAAGKTNVYGTVRGRYATRDCRSKPKVLQSLKRGASAFRVSIPKIKDVNKIDKYSRVVFPVAYLIFNAIYWSFYILSAK